MLCGRRTDHLGVRDGRLAPCPGTPNCVSSQVDPREDAGHHILPMAADAEAAWGTLLDILRGLPRVKLLVERGDYVHAEVTSRVFRFVDDVELLLDRNARVIHVRSASRLGRSDFGVNRRRVEDLRRRLAERMPRG